MKLVLIIQILFFSLFSPCCFGQDTQLYDIKMEDSQYYIGNVEFNTTSITLKNINSRGIVFWLSDKESSNIRTQEKFKDFLFQVKGDFSLFQLMTDNITSLPPPILYVSFFKYIAPNESFSIHVLSKGAFKKEQKMKIRNCLINKINAMDIDRVNKFIDNNMLKPFSYKNSSICLALETL